MKQASKTDKEVWVKMKKKAMRVLDQNTFTVASEGRTYRMITPTKEYYAHKWNWDSATVAMGLVSVDYKRAHDEILSLIAGQWENGLIAQITFNPKERKYFPGPQFWGTKTFRRGEIITSGISQPPFLGYSAWYVYKKTPNKKVAKKFLMEILPALKKYHAYLKKFRDPEDCGLLTMIHPWESGLDNSPRWDTILERIDLASIPVEVKILVNTYRADDTFGNTVERPHLADYYRYMYLIDLFQKMEWDYKKIVQTSPFAVKGLVFNSLWCISNEALSELCKEVGQLEEAKLYKKLALQTRQALKESWSEKDDLFLDYNVSQGKNEPIVENSIATFLPLLAKAASQKQYLSLFKRLTDPSQYWTAWPIPTVSLTNPKFESARYWRGPTWPITNFFILTGLQHYQDDPEHEGFWGILVRKTMQMITQYGFCEYFVPTEEDIKRLGRGGLGFTSLSWTAALYLYLLEEYRSIAHPHL